MQFSGTQFLKSRQAKILSAVLIAQAALFYGMSRAEANPKSRPLSELSEQLGNWRMSKEGVVDEETRSVLKADELLNREYVNQDLRVGANLFVAYFKTQRTGQMPHSPKNCLPGNGWTETLADTVKVTVPGRDEPIEVNRYLVAKGENKSVVVYWYQSRDRVVASEYRARFYTAADAIRYNRTDTALIRVVVPVMEGDEKRATDAALNFVKDFFVPLRQHFPA
ncbi:MAG: exosortase C-terminal domain/associated protein EpsI [Bryobacteraceae bacterium]